MRRCFYHTDLRQNAVFHNFSKQIALIQYSGRSKHAWAFSETAKKNFPKSPIRPAGCELWSVNRITLQHNNEFIIIIFCYLMVPVITMCNVIYLPTFSEM